jgi:phosphomannomutase
MRSLKVGVAGMRGVIGTGLIPARIIDFTTAFGTLIDGGNIIVANDSRTSSEMVSHAVLSSLLSCGCNVLQAGIMPAPVLHYLIPKLNADGGILIGGAHQGAGWNAVVPISTNGAYFNNLQLQELLDVYHSHRYLNVKWDKIGKVDSIPTGAADSYLDSLCSIIDVQAIRNAKFTVVADFCNGSGSILADKFASCLGIKLIAINNVVSGVLPHDPEPRPRSSFQAQSIVLPLQADCGMVFNSDMSRMALVSNDGETLSEEYTLPLLADYLLSRNPAGQTVIINSCSTKTMDDVVAKYGGELVKVKVGQSIIIDKMSETNALLAGEGNGSVALKGWVNGFDSFMAAALCLEAMAVKKMKLSQLVSALPRYFIVKKSITCPAAHAYSIIHSLKNKFPSAKITDDDGVRFDWDDSWISLRASSTEPLIRMIAESKNKEHAIDLAMHVRGTIERLVAT